MSEISHSLPDEGIVSCSAGVRLGRGGSGASMMEVNLTREKIALTISQHPFRPSLCSTETPPSDPSCSGTHFKYCWPPRRLLLPLFNTSILASPLPVCHIHSFLERWALRYTRPSLQLSPLPARLVTLRLIFPSPTSPFRATSSNAQIHLWLSSSWHHLSWRLCCFCHGGTWILPALSWYYEYSFDSGLQFSCAILPRLCPCDGSCFCLKRIM